MPALPLLCCPSPGVTVCSNQQLLLLCSNFVIFHQGDPILLLCSPTTSFYLESATPHLLLLLSLAEIYHSLMSCPVLNYHAGSLKRSFSLQEPCPAVLGHCNRPRGMASWRGFLQLPGDASIPATGMGQLQIFSSLDLSLSLWSGLRKPNPSGTMKENTHPRPRWVCAAEGGADTDTLCIHLHSKEADHGQPR